jgi:hypothetical protein
MTGMGPKTACGLIDQKSAKADDEMKGDFSKKALEWRNSASLES